MHPKEWCFLRFIYVYIHLQHGVCKNVCPTNLRCGLFHVFQCVSYAYDMILLMSFATYQILPGAWCLVPPYHDLPGWCCLTKSPDEFQFLTSHHRFHARIFAWRLGCMLEPGRFATCRVRRVDFNHDSEAPGYKSDVNSMGISGS